MRDSETEVIRYRAGVGPADKYDIIGAMQFIVMINLGLRDFHYLLDIGCGSLRGGRLFIPYLLSGHYFGIEPNKALVKEGVRKELGQSIWYTKMPKIAYRDDFRITRCFEQKFDFILAQSIFSHATQAQIATCLKEAKKCLVPKGVMAATYFKGSTNYTGNTWAQSPDAHYTKLWMKDICRQHGFVYQELNRSHPSNQTWFTLRHIND